MPKIKSLVNPFLAILFGSFILSQAVSAEQLFAARVVVEQGTLTLDKNKSPKLMKPKGCEANRGIINGRVNFKSKFTKAPFVMLGLTQLDFLKGANHRITVSTTKVDKKGFNYNFNTWCDTKVWSAKAQWIAIGR